MTYLVFMNYIMLVAICGNNGIVTSDEVWIGLDILCVIALFVHLNERIKIHAEIWGVKSRKPQVL